jgi:hypothetical protein
MEDCTNNSFLHVDMCYVHIVNLDGVKICLWTAAANRYIVHPPDNGSMEPWWNDINKGNQGTWTKTCPSTKLSNIKVTWTDPGVNPDKCHNLYVKYQLFETQILYATHLSSLELLHVVNRVCNLRNRSHPGQWIGKKDWTKTHSII